MQLKKAETLRRAWIEKGNPSCEHPEVDKEYYLGTDTGDEVCTTCGRSAPPGTLQPSDSPIAVRTEQVFTREGDFPETLR